MAPRFPRLRSVARLVGVTVLAAVACAASHAHAQPDPSTPKEAAKGVEPALVTAVSKATAPIADRVQAGVVAGAPLASDAPAPRGAALVAEIVRLVAGSLGPAARARANPMSLSAARAEAATSDFLVYVRAAIAEGQIRLTLDAYPIPRNIWDRSRSGSPGPVAHGFGSARIDAEVRTFLAPIPLVASQPVKTPLPDPEVVALSCQDFDGDGALEILIVSRRKLALGRVRDGQFSVIRQARWQDLSPIAPVPWRQPLATISYSAPGRLDIGLTDRAASVRLDPRLRKVASYPHMPIPWPGGTACAHRRVGSLRSDLVPCIKAEPAPEPDAAFHFDAAARARIVDKEGRVREVWAVRNPTDGTVALRDDQGREHELRHLGAQIALTDLDLDGDPDLLATKDVLHAKHDALVVRSWRDDGSVDKRVQWPVPDGVAAVAACPPDGPGPRAVALATSKELWILR